MNIPFSFVTPVPGQSILFHGKEMAFGLPLPDGRYTLTNLETGEIKSFTSNEWAQQYLNGYVEELEPRTTIPAIKKKKLSRLDFTTASEDHKAAARRKAAYIQALTEFDVKKYVPSQYKLVIDQVA